MTGLLILCLPSVWAQVRVMGVIRDAATNKPLVGIPIALVSPNESEALVFGVSDLDGGYEMVYEKAGTYDVLILVEGYQAFRRPIVLMESKEMRYDVRLQIGELVLKPAKNRGRNRGKSE